MLISLKYIQKLNLSFKNIDYFCIIRLLFNGFVKYPNTKKQPLINSSIIINCKEMQQYLLKIHYSLDIEKWIINDNGPTIKKAKYQPIGKTILNKIRTNLDKIISDFKKNTNNINNYNTTQQIPIIRPPQIFNNNNTEITSSLSSYIGTRKTCSYHRLGMYVKIKIYMDKITKILLQITDIIHSTWL